MNPAPAIATDTEALIVARNLVKAFDGTPAVDNLSLQVLPGEIYGLVGPDGAGKTTTMRLLVGALKQDSGEAFVGGYDVATQVDRAREQIGYMPQRFSLYGDLTVGENLRFFAEVNGLPAGTWKPRSQEILDFVGLAEFIDRRADHLSGGMRQKLGLATALVHQPRILLLDEPTGGVDPVTRQDFWQLILRLVGEEGMAALVSTPYMDEAIRCNRIGFMSTGRLLVEGVPQRIAVRLEGRVLELVGRPRSIMKTTAAADPDVENIQMFGNRLHLRVRSGTTEQVIQRLRRSLKAAGAEVEELRPVAPSLEDAFIELLETG